MPCVQLAENAEEESSTYKDYAEEAPEAIPFGRSGSQASVAQSKGGFGTEEEEEESLAFYSHSGEQNCI